MRIWFRHTPSTDSGATITTRLIPYFICRIHIVSMTAFVLPDRMGMKKAAHRFLLRLRRAFRIART
jgi:hypothetical protein